MLTAHSEISKTEETTDETETISVSQTSTARAMTWMNIGRATPVWNAEGILEAG